MLDTIDELCLISPIPMKLAAITSSLLEIIQLFAMLHNVALSRLLGKSDQFALINFSNNIHTTWTVAKALNVTFFGGSALQVLTTDLLAPS